MRTKIYGPPGTGKTKILEKLCLHYSGQSENAKYDLKNVGFPAEYLIETEGRYDLREISYITFQNSALKEFVEDRLGMGLGSDRRRGGPLRYFRTMHGVCCVLLYDAGIINFDPWDKESPTDKFGEFCRKIGIKFDPEVMGMANRFLPGNLLWQKITEVVNKYYLEEGENIKERVWREINRISPALARHYVEWEKYKEKLGILDYNDMLIRAYEELKKGRIYLPTKVLIVDEFQDFSPLQFGIFNLLAQEKKEVIIAGDDWQTLFVWVGADPKFLIEWKADFEIVLRKSFRLPERICNVIQRYASREFRNLKMKEIIPQGLEGKIVKLPFKMHKPSDLQKLREWLKHDLKTGKRVFVLTRTNSQAFYLITKLILMGFSPQTLKRDIWYINRKRVNGVLVSYVDLIRAIQGLKLQDLTPRDIRILLAVSGYRVEKNMDLPTYEKLEEILQNFDIWRVRKIWKDAPWRAIDILQQLMDAKITERIEGDLYVDTIHASKGREADYVFLINEMPTRKWRKILSKEDWEAEKRVWFVGLTRARRGLAILVHPRKGFPLRI